MKLTYDSGVITLTVQTVRDAFEITNLAHTIQAERYNVAIGIVDGAQAAELQLIIPLRQRPGPRGPHSKTVPAAEEKVRLTGANGEAELLPAGEGEAVQP